MRRLINRHPGRGARIALGALPFVALLVLYVVASNLRLAENENDKLLPALGTIAETFHGYAFEEDKRSGQVLFWVDTWASLRRIGTALLIAGVMLVAPFLVAVRNPDPEKVSAYECGFNAFDDARMKFDVRFYLVSILFIIFDLEVAFLFPWAVAFGDLGAFGFWSMVVFLGVLTIGFIYEWQKGALEWD